MEFNPRKVFTQLFGEGDTETERSDRGADAQPTRLIADRTAALQRASRRRCDGQVLLDQYLSTVREIERRVEGRASAVSAITLPEAPIGELDSFDEQVKLMFDLLALAYPGDLTRVASYIMVSRARTARTTHIGVSDAFHPLSHHANKKDVSLSSCGSRSITSSASPRSWRRWRLRPDGDGSLLDHSLFMYGSNMSNSDRHNNYPLPNILVGGANGRQKAASRSSCPSTRR